MKKQGKTYLLKLFISGTTPQSQRALSSLRNICEKYLDGDYELEVVDVYQNPRKASEHQIIAVPTLLKQFPLPLRKFIGDLSNEENILEGLGVPMKKAKSK